MFRALALRQSDWRNCGLCVGLYARSGAALLVTILPSIISFSTLYGGQFTFSTQLFALNYLLYTPTDIAPQFL